MRTPWCPTYFGQGSWCRFGKDHGSACQPGRDSYGKLLTRTVTALLVLLAASTASAKWVLCNSACTAPQPTVTVSGLSPLPLYKGNVRFGGEVKESGTVRWLWLRVDPAPTCTQAQLANLQDRVYGCGARVGDVLLRTERVRQAQ